jgi:NAD(P)-dependent dehydrogenase (short-subunit alcohol dehydrogenase family)
MSLTRERAAAKGPRPEPERSPGDAPDVLAGRVAAVTGGSSGIGRAIAIALADHGADVAVGARSATTSPLARDRLAGAGRCCAIDLDLRSVEAVEAFNAAVIDTFGRVDILVNAAGICDRHHVSGHPDDLWHEVIDVNLTGAFRMTRTHLPAMIANRWGRIVNIASDIATLGVAEYAAYTVSKAGLLALTRCAGREGAPHGVTCNAISPGWVDTPMTARAIDDAASSGDEPGAVTREAIEAALPQRRLITTGEIAALAVFLCTDDARGITMQDLVVSGGQSW